MVSFIKNTISKIKTYIKCFAKNKTFDVKLVKLDVPYPSNNTYATTTIQESIGNWKKRQADTPFGGLQYGVLRSRDHDTGDAVMDALGTNVNSISHTVNDVYIHDGWMMGNITIVSKVPYGNMLLKVIKKIKTTDNLFIPAFIQMQMGPDHTAAPLHLLRVDASV